MRSLGLLEGVLLVQAVQCGDVRPPDRCGTTLVHERARLEVATFSWPASGLRTAA